MPEHWKQRLRVAIDASGRSLRSISMDAGLGPGYLHSVLVEGKDPTVASLTAIATALGLSVSEIVDGNPTNPDTKELLEAWASVPKEQRKALLDLLRGWQRKSPPRG